MTDALLKCRDAIHRALTDEMAHRGADLTWVDRERYAVADAATRWAEAHDIGRVVTVEDVERVEVRAVGRVDYASKLSLYVAELVVAKEGDR